MNILRYLCILAVTWAVSPAAALAQTIINSVPYTITASGKYQVGTNLVGPGGSQNLITISAPNVILDLNGFFVSGPGANTSSGAAIFVGEVSNVTIRNGTLANQGTGILFTGHPNSLNHLVEDVNFTRIFGVGVTFLGFSPGTILRRNTFSQIGGGPAANSSPAAMSLFGGTRVENNSIATVTGSGTGTSTGISGSTTDFAVGNTISNCGIGISGCKYLNNLTSGCATPFQGGVNAIGNN